MKRKHIVWILFIVLFLWSIPYAGNGIDVRDTASYLTKYRYFFDPSVKVNELHYFLGEALGAVIYWLVPTHKVLALNIVSSILYSLSAVIVYKSLKEYADPLIRVLCVLVGTFYGIPWVRTLNWNAWTVLWLSVGLWLLLKGLKKENKVFLFFSGFVLAINTYFRMPNMLFLSLIVVIFWKSYWESHSVKKAVLSCKEFFLGAVCAAVAGLLLACLLLGTDTVLGNLSMLTSVGAGQNEGNTHSITTGIYLFLLGIKQGAVLWICIGGVLFLLAVLFAKGIKHNKPALLATGLIGIYLGCQRDILDAHVWIAAASIVLGIAGAFYYAKKDIMFSCLCVAVTAIQGFLTIGTDTGINFYRVYMGLPFLFVMLFFQKAEAQEGKLSGESVRLFLKMAQITTFLFVLIAGVRYATTHVYHDAPNKELTQSIDHELYKGIHTSKERAESLNRLMKELKPYEDEKLLQIGCFNIGCVLTDMKPFYDSSWPDLEYLPMDVFTSKLEEAIKEKELPVILLGTAEESGINWSPHKYKLIYELAQGEYYDTLYQDEIYTIYVPAKGE